MDPVAACAQLKSGLALPNTTILDALYYTNFTAGISTLGTCNATADVEVPLCRLQFVVNTSNTSAITAEAWLPTDWNGRFLALGNGGLAGCIDYTEISYGSSLQFATVASNNGHDGDTGVYFVNNSEVLNDFTSRAIHVESAVGKQIVETYYGRPHNKSYYLGCSQGGRQGAYAALYYPEDFDGILAGSPATNFQHLFGWSAMLTKYLGAPDPDTSDTFISSDLWSVIANETLIQCDELDGVKDGVITEPDDCDFRPETLQCTADRTEECLSLQQVEALKKIYEPLYGREGQLLFPRFDPGAEGSPLTTTLFSGQPYPYWMDWIENAILNTTDYDFRNFTLDDIAFADSVDPGKISTFNGNMSAFRDRGGKLLTYQGRRDILVASGNAKSFYNLISRTLKMPLLDSFYRLFLVPGMEHCNGGVGAVNFGQLSPAYKSDDPSSNILLALVEWVENGTAPQTMTGLSDDGKEQRTICRYPQKSVWDGSKYVCKEGDL